MALGNRIKKNTEEKIAKSGGGFDLESLQKMQEYKVKECGLEEFDVLPGIITGIVDLGLQPQQDGESLLADGESKEEILEKFPKTKFKTIEGKEYKCYPRKPELCVAFVVDFPDIKLNLGQFFKEGDEEEKPLRLVMSGEYFLRGPKLNVISRPTPLKDTNKEFDGQYSLHPKSTAYQMALGAKIISPGEPFRAQDIESLLGKAFQFKVRVHFKKGKNGKQYFTQACAYQAPLARGQSAPAYDEGSLFTVCFDEENPKEVLEQLGAPLKNTMMLATDYADPKNLIKGQLEGIDPWRKEKYEEIAGNSEEGEEEEDALEVLEDLDIIEDEEDGIELEDADESEDDGMSEDLDDEDPWE